jgi:hypothetical protein
MLDILVNHLCRLKIESDPRQCPGGTPDVTGTDVEEVPFITTVCVLSDKNALIQFNISFWIP